jgi:hypothetical protein
VQGIILAHVELAQQIRFFVWHVPYPVLSRNVDLSDQISVDRYLYPSEEEETPSGCLVLITDVLLIPDSTFRTVKTVLKKKTDGLEKTKKQMDLRKQNFYSNWTNGRVGKKDGEKKEATKEDSNSGPSPVKRGLSESYIVWTDGHTDVFALIDDIWSFHVILLKPCFDLLSSPDLYSSSWSKTTNLFESHWPGTTVTDSSNASGNRAGEW